MPEHSDLYGVLGINKDAQKAEIRKAYKKKVLKCHPDKNLLSSGNEFKRVQQAYEILGDTRQKKTYDDRARSRSVPPMPTGNNFKRNNRQTKRAATPTDLDISEIIKRDKEMMKRKEELRRRQEYESAHANTLKREKSTKQRAWLDEQEQQQKQDAERRERLAKVKEEIAAEKADIERRRKEAEEAAAQAREERMDAIRQFKLEQEIDPSVKQFQSEIEKRHQQRLDSLHKKQQQGQSEQQARKARMNSGMRQGSTTLEDIHEKRLNEIKQRSQQLQQDIELRRKQNTALREQEEQQRKANEQQYQQHLEDEANQEVERSKMARVVADEYKSLWDDLNRYKQQQEQHHHRQSSRHRPELLKSASPKRLSKATLPPISRSGSVSPVGSCGKCRSL